ncbi:MAG: chemotaxis protein CheW [Spirochaetes bacterium]|nr:chemotaxis protein CheW [Spirochaetota bacterium]
MEIQELLRRLHRDENSIASSTISSSSPNELEKESSVEIIQLVTFVIDDVEYGVDILSVHEILRLPEITRLPNVPKFIRGVINLRGNVIPVVDIRERFGISKARFTELTRIIVVEIGEKLVGLLVDNVHQVVRIPEKDIDPPSDLIEGVSEDFIKGIGKLKDRLIVILNLGYLLFSDEER